MRGDLSRVAYGFRRRRCTGQSKRLAPNDTAYTRCSSHSGLANPVQIVSTPPAPSNGYPITVLWASRPCEPAGWLAMLLLKAGDVETNPGPTTTRTQVWMCDICHRQIQVRKKISIWCNRIEHNIQVPGPAINTDNPHSQPT